jgi:hypothetical protein
LRTSPSGCIRLNPPGKGLYEALQEFVRPFIGKLAGRIKQFVGPADGTIPSSAIRTRSPAQREH